MWTRVIITALFTIGRTWKQPRCPSADEWIRKLWYICKMEYYSAIKKNAFESVLMRWMKLEPIIQSDAKSWLIGKDSDAGRYWGQEEKGTPEDEMDGWHHWLDGLESPWTPGVCDGQEALACCNSWGRKESDTTEQLNWTNTVLVFFFLAYFTLYNRLQFHPPH